MKMAKSSSSEEPLIISSSPQTVVSDEESSASANINLERSFKHYYRVQNLVLAVGFINLLITCFLHYPTVKKIGLYSTLIFQSTIWLIPYFAHMVIRNVESCGDDHRFHKWPWSKNRLPALKIWNILGIIVGIYGIIVTLGLYYSTSTYTGLVEILRLVDTYAYMGGVLQWVWLCGTTMVINVLRNAANNKKCRPMPFLTFLRSFYCFCCFPIDYEIDADSEASAGHDGDHPTAYYDVNVAAKNDQDFKDDCPV